MQCGRGENEDYEVGISIVGPNPKWGLRSRYFPWLVLTQKIKGYNIRSHPKIRLEPAHLVSWYAIKLVVWEVFIAVQVEKLWSGGLIRHVHDFRM